MLVEHKKIIPISRVALHEMKKTLGEGALNKSGSDITPDALRDATYKKVCMYSGKPLLLVQAAWNIRSISVKEIMTLSTQDLSSIVRSFDNFGGAY